MGIYYVQWIFDREAAERAGSIRYGEKFGVMYCDREAFVDFLNMYLEQKI